MKTQIRKQLAFLYAIKKLASAMTFIAVFAGVAAAQTNTFPTSGNAGVGTTTPALQSGTTSTMLEVKGTVNPGVAVTSTATGGRQYFVYSSQANPGYFSVFDATAGADRFVISNSGNVGIGTANPSERLHVYNNVGNTYILADALNANHSVFSLRSAGSETGAFYRPAGTNDVRIWSGADRITVLNSSGNVGIGTANPAYRLHVRAGNGSGQFGDHTTSQLFYQIRPDAGKQGWLAFTEDGVADRWAIGIKNGDAKLYFSAGNLASLADRMSLDANGNLSVTGNIAAKYQDLAEWVPSAEQLSAGTVVVLDTTKSNQVISSSMSYDTRVAGVISAQPGITLGESGKGKVLVATTGRVRVKVDASRGPIQIGDLLVTSDVSGVAMKSEAVNLGGVQIHRPGTIIGKALEPLTKGTGEILVLLSLQ